MIPYNDPLTIGNEIKYIKQALKNRKLSGDGPFSRKCTQKLENILRCFKVILTPSGTAALELAAILADVKEGDEIIMSSYTFSSTANAFVLRGAKIIFVDIRPDTMNIDEKLIEKAITKKTKAIVPMHYAGLACSMDKIMALARKYHLFIIEDAAQGIKASYKGKYLGSFGDFGCLSFHETKNITCGEGGALLINKKAFVKRAEIIQEKGTNRAKFLRGEIDKYTWVDLGSSYLVNEISSAYLLAQLENIDKITNKRLLIWNNYYKLLEPLQKKGYIDLPQIPKECKHNGHIFYIKAKNLADRTRLIKYLKSKKIMAVYRYVPLHSAQAGKKYGNFFGNDLVTTKESQHILRLPLFYRLKNQQIRYITDCIKEYYQNEKNI